jgi:FkbM family methyltransferase
MIRSIVKQALRGLGLELRRVRHVELPFGVNWCYDLAALAGPGHVRIAFDVGANVGDVSRRLASYFPGITVHAFEPVEATFSQLVENTKHLSCVTAVNIALGDRAGYANVTQDLSRQNTLLVDDVARRLGADIKATRVAVETIDGYCERAGVQRIDFLKIDTEGFEVKVLGGASRSLQTGMIEFLLLECEFHSRLSAHPHGDFGEILSSLSQYNYRVVSFYTGGVDDQGWRWGDVLFRRTIGEEEGPLRVSHRLRDIHSLEDQRSK